MRALPVSVLSLAFLLALPVAGQGHKLNGPLARTYRGNFEYGRSPDGRHLVYFADPDQDGWKTYSATLDGKSAPVRLLAGSVFSPDGKRCIGAADPDGDGLVELVSEPVDGSGPWVSLSPPFSSLFIGGKCCDQTSLLFLAGPTDESYELFVVPLDGSAPSRRLSRAEDAGINGALQSRDGRVVVYHRWTDLPWTFFVVPSDGSALPRELSLPLTLGRYFGYYELDRDGSHLLYAADEEESEHFEIFSMPIDGSHAPSKLNGPLVEGGDAGWGAGGELFPAFLTSRDGHFLLYLADAEEDERIELYAVPTDASGPPRKLSSPEHVKIVPWIQSLDSAWFLYLTDPSRTGAYELFSVPIDGSAPPRRLSGPMVPGAGLPIAHVSYDSHWVVYECDQDVQGVHELFAVPIDGSAPPVKLNGPLPPGAGVFLGSYSLDPVSTERGLVFSVMPGENGYQDLYLAPFPPGQEPRRLESGPIGSWSPVLQTTASPYEIVDETPRDLGLLQYVQDGTFMLLGTEPGARPIPLQSGTQVATVGQISGFALDASGSRALYLARQEGDPVARVHSVSTGERREERTSDAPGSQSLLASPDGLHVVYRGLFGLASGPIDASTAPVTLFTGDSTGESFTPDGRSLLVHVTIAGRRTLFSVPIDGSAPTRDLGAALPVGDQVTEVVQASAHRVVFRSNRQALWAVPVDGSTPAVQVTADQQRAMEDFQVSGDGRLVVFRTVPRGELFAVPTDASAAPLPLHDPLPTSRRVARFVLAPDGERTYYLSNPAEYGRYELYGVPTDASAPPLRLSGPMVTGGGVTELQLAPDGRTLVYLADAHEDGRFELLRVPSDGSLPPALVGRSPSASGSVRDYRISPDSRSVVYRADASSPGVIDLFSAPVRGSRGIRRIGQAPFPGGNVADFEISADSRTVLFRAERDDARELTLLATPIGGEQKAVEIAGPFAGAGRVLDFASSAEGRVLVYRANQDDPNVFELFAVRLPELPSVHARAR